MYTFDIPGASPEKLFHEGINAYRHGDATNAMEKLNEAIYWELQQEQTARILLSNIYNMRGEVFLSQGIFLRSHNDFNDAIVYNPYNENAMNNMGLWYMREDLARPDYRKSLEYFDRAVLLAPHRQDIIFNRAIARIKSGNFMGYEDLKKLELEKYEAASRALNEYGE